MEKNVQDLRREIEELKSRNDGELLRITAELSSAKKEVERLMAELRKLLDQKMVLELEVAQYKLMVDLEKGHQDGCAALLFLKSIL